MRELMFKRALLVCFCAVNPLIANAEYRTKSVFDTDYKCAAAEEGGYNHTASGHKIGRYRPDTVFFLTHISNIRKETVLNIVGDAVAEHFNNDIAAMRAYVEDRYLEQEKFTDSLVAETGSFFIRKSSEDPAHQWMLGECKAYLSDGEGTVTCIESDEIFTLNMKTGRFSFAYLGSWHRENEADYYGDSSVFAFGKCEKYYR